MAEYSRQDAEYAANVVRRLLNRESEGLELEPDVAVSDVESDASAFSDELALLEDLNANVPAVRISEEKVPVSLSFAFGRSAGWPLLPPFGPRLERPWRRHPFFYEYAYDYLRTILREDREFDGFTSLNREEARETFLRRATDFVANRIASVRIFRNRGAQTWHGVSFLSFRQLLRGQQITTPGCNFTVSSNSSGLRVFWSGAYYVTPNYFSHPTSPTAGVLQSGTYIFGIDGGAYGNNIQWDLNSVISLPGSPHVHLNY